MAKKKMLWVVELLIRRGIWKPTVGVRFDRASGREELADWRRTLPDDQLRLRPYVRKAVSR